MISVKVQGGLGNQLFHYAAALQLSENTNEGVLLNNSYFEDEKFKVLYRLDKFSIDFTETQNNQSRSEVNSIISRIKQKLFYKTGFFPFPGSNVIKGDLLPRPVKKLEMLNKNEHFLLEGWLQRIDYFEKVKNTLSEKLWLKSEFAASPEQVKIIKNTDSVAVHIRRGDMMKNSNFISLDAGYYEKAINLVLQLKKNAHFFVFSDEPDKARELFRSFKVPVTFITEQSESLGYYGTKGDYIDFELMRLCRNYIIANSTFSWWPAYLSLNPEKVIVAPSEWFANEKLQKDFTGSGLLQKKWYKI